MPFHNCIAPFEFVAGCLRPIPRGCWIRSLMCVRDLCVFVAYQLLSPSAPADS